MGPPVWPWRCGLMARPVSGVEWSGVEHSCSHVIIFKFWGPQSYLWM